MKNGSGRFRVQHIQACSTDHPLIQSGDQILLHYAAAAARIDEKRLFGAASEFFQVKESSCLGVECLVVGNNIRGGQRRVTVYQLQAQFPGILRPEGVGDHLYIHA